MVLQFVVNKLFLGLLYLNLVPFSFFHTDIFLFCSIFGKASYVCDIYKFVEIS